jgi:hypothetical protein
MLSTAGYAESLTDQKCVIIQCALVAVEDEMLYLS